MTEATTLTADEIVERMRSGEQTWAETPVATRRDLLARLHTAVGGAAEEWVRIAARIKQLPDGSPLVGEEWISGPYAVLQYTTALGQTLDRIAQGEDVLAGYKITRAPGGRVAVRVLPHGTYDRLLLSGFSAEVWMPPGVSEQRVRAEAGLGQRHPADTGGVALVLGAGNIFSIAPLDVLYHLYADNRVAILKLNPITEPLLPVLERVFAPFIERRLVEIVTGGAELGSALAYHPGVSAVHVTGSEATHDAVVWGPGEQGAANKAAGTPRLQKPMTSELGGVSPVIVVPGIWSTADITFQAQHVATQRLHNSGHNCIAGQIVIVGKDWPQKTAFLQALRDALRDAPARPTWYPGGSERATTVRREHAGAEAVGGTPDRTLLPGLDLADPGEPAFDSEFFGPVLGETELPGGPAEFLDAAVDAANQRLHGTLGANILIHPATARQLGTRLDDAIARLRYGTIAVNAWTGVGYLTPRASWGAFPGHPLDDIQSGRGVVHNALLLDHPERTVVRGPFRPAPRSIAHAEWAMTPKPPWFVDNRTADQTGRRLTIFTAKPRAGALPGIFASALRG